VFVYRDTDMSRAQFHDTLATPSRITGADPLLAKSNSWSGRATARRDIGTARCPVRETLGGWRRRRDGRGHVWGMEAAGHMEGEYYVPTNT